MIETYAYARAGLLGNPSDGYYGKTLAVIVRNFRARVVLYPSARLEIKPSKADMPIFESLDDLYESTRWRGYYGGIRIIQALIIGMIAHSLIHIRSIAATSCMDSAPRWGLAAKQVGWSPGYRKPRHFPSRYWIGQRP